MKILAVFALFVFRAFAADAPKPEPLPDSLALDFRETQQFVSAADAEVSKAQIAFYEAKERREEAVKLSNAEVARILKEVNCEKCRLLMTEIGEGDKKRMRPAIIRPKEPEKKGDAAPVTNSKVEAAKAKRP